MHNKFLLILILVCLPVLQGCFVLLVGSAVTAAGYAYVKGGLQGEFNVPLKEANKATLKALQELGYYVLIDELNIESSTLKAETATGKTVEVHINKLTDESVNIQARSGLFGNEETAFRILDAISDQLI